MLSEELPATLSKISFPKSMRWNSEVCAVLIYGKSFLMSNSSYCLTVLGTCFFLHVHVAIFVNDLEYRYFVFIPFISWGFSL